MSELLPSIQAAEVRRGLLDYLTTTFALADADTHVALREFLGDPVDGMFKGPYVRLRLPFRPADSGWQRHVGWDIGFTPYGHQAQFQQQGPRLHQGQTTEATPISPAR